MTPKGGQDYPVDNGELLEIMNTLFELIPPTTVNQLVREAYKNKGKN